MSIRTSLTRNDRAGFSLLEILIVIALMGIIMVAVAPGLTSAFRISLNSATRGLASTVKEAYNSAIITGQVHRVVYDLGKNQYWVERGPSTALMDTAESKEREERRRKMVKDDAPPKSEFALDRSVTRSKQSLPRGVTFEDVSTQASGDPIAEGIAYTHIFPHGLAEQTLIHLTDDSKKRISLVISPLVGRTDLYERFITSEEAFGR